jgi:transcription elongation factor Elf1
MSCDICGRTSCCVSFHSHEEQDRYSEVIEAFERARELRAEVRNEEDDDEQ